MGSEVTSRQRSDPVDRLRGEVERLRTELRQIRSSGRFKPGETDKRDLVLYDADGVELVRWDDSADGWAWATHADFVVNAILWGTELRYLVGPDAGDQWQLVPQDSGDSLAIRQWDDSASATIDRIKIIGKGTAVTDEGDMISYDLDGVEVVRYDESDGRWEYAAPPSGIAGYEEFFEEGTLTTKTGDVRWYPPFDITITDVSIFVGGTVPTGASIIVDVDKGGTTIFTTQSNRPEIAVSTNHDVSGVPDITGVDKDTEYLTVNIDQIGSTIAGADMVIQIRFVSA